MEKTPLQIFEERNEKDCCLNCKKLIVKQTDADHECAIIADGGNLCFGYRMEGQEIVVYTD